jgi:hypothetical protein
MGFFEAIAGWFGTLKLPGRVVFGLFLFCLLLLGLDYADLVRLGAIDDLAWPITAIGMLLFFCLSLAAAGGECYDAWKQSYAEKRVRRRRQDKRYETELARGLGSQQSRAKPDDRRTRGIAGWHGARRPLPLLCDRFRLGGSARAPRRVPR